MKLLRYRFVPAGLVQALTADELLDRYQAGLAEELPGLADPAMAQHLRRMAALAAAVRAHGFALLARRDPGAADGLLSDLLATATWHGWDLPLGLIDGGEIEADTAGLPRGLLGHDAEVDGAGVWVLDPATLGLARWRTAGTT